jgi:hypothetical protein
MQNGIMQSMQNETLKPPPTFNYDDPESYKPNLPLPSASDFPQVDRALSFEECKDAALREDWDSLIRWPGDLVIYSRFAIWAKEHYRSVEDFIKIQYFKFPYSQDSNRYIALEKPADLKWNPTLRRNNFPYAIQPDVNHLILWSLADLTTEDIHDTLQQKLSLETWDFFWFENPGAKKTVPGVNHVHVFVRSKTQSPEHARLALHELIE